MLRKDCVVINTAFEENLAQATCLYTPTKYSATFSTALHLVIKAPMNFCLCPLTDKPLYKTKKKQNKQNTQLVSCTHIDLLSQI